MNRVSRKVPYVFLLPYIVLFTLFLVFPVCYSFFMSLFVQKQGVKTFVGFGNYIQAFSDYAFWSGMGRVALYGVSFVTIMLVLALAVALFLDSPFIKSKSFFRLVYFLPYAVPGVIAATMWGFLYSPQLNPLLHFLGIFNGGQPLNLLSSNNLLIGIINISIWEWVGYNMTIYFANLTSIPLDIYDSAKIDGCNEFRTAIYIKVPMIKSTIYLTILLSIIGSIQLFNEPFVLSAITNIPVAFTPNMYIYNMAFSFANLPYSATLSIILVIITVFASGIFMKMTSEK